MIIARAKRSSLDHRPKTTVVVGVLIAVVLSASTLLELLHEVMDFVEDKCGLCGLVTNFETVCS